MIVADTSGVLAGIDPDQKRHSDCARIVREWRGRFVISPFVLNELDYLAAKLLGADTALKLLKQVVERAYILEAFTSEHLAEAIQIMEKYADLKVGIADASSVVIARRQGIREIFTLDERHFRVLPGPRNRPFRILPADAPRD